MGVGENANWIIRVIVMIIATAALVGLYSLLAPVIEASPLRADALSARVIHNGGFLLKPGIIDETKFTQDVADSLSYGEDYLYPAAVAVSLYDPQTSTVMELDGRSYRIIYNVPGYEKLYPQFEAGLKGTYQKLRAYPYTLQRANGDRVSVDLVLEAYYE